MSNYLHAIIESKWTVLLIVLISFLMHLEVLNLDLVGFHVWRQTQTQATIESFAYEDLNILNPRRNERGAGEGIFRMEFPLAQWITALPVKISDTPVMVSRIVNFVFGIISMFGVYYLVRYLFSSALLALLSVWLLAFTPVFYYYTMNPMPDNLALALSLWGICFFIKWYRGNKILDFIMMIILMALSGLCKLPFVLFLILPSIVLAWDLLANKIPLSGLIRYGLIFFIGLAPIAAWYLWVIPTWEGNGIVTGIISMSDEQKSLFWYYLWFNLRTNLPELIIGLPAVPLFAAGLIFTPALMKRSKQLSISFLALVVMLISLVIFEINMIEKVHDYYLIPFIPVFILISTLGLKKLINISHRRKWVLVTLIIMMLGMPVYSYFRVSPRWEKAGFNENLLLHKTELRAAVPDSALVCAGNDRSHHIFLYYIGKKGWVFEQDWMGPEKLDSLVGLGCEYLYTDSRHVDQNPGIQSLFEMKVANFGDINVYKLKRPFETGAGMDN